MRCNNDFWREPLRQCIVEMRQKMNGVAMCGILARDHTGVQGLELLERTCSGGKPDIKIG